MSCNLTHNVLLIVDSKIWLKQDISEELCSIVVYDKNSKRVSFSYRLVAPPT